MKVLMFGWEFPPHITGGLGTACYGITKGLTSKGIDVTFVVPKAYGDEDHSVARIVNASDVNVNIYDPKYIDVMKNVTYVEINSTLIPYAGPAEYEKYYNKLIRNSVFNNNPIYNTKYSFSGSYNNNLFEEVARYAMVGAQVAMQYDDFDVIHAHDWLTYSAGIAAKKISGKPLVCHIHATEFDRTGENVNTIVYDLEKNGMQQADMVIAVSNLTANTVIKKYKVNPDKVVTIHNAITTVDKDITKYKKNIDAKIVTFLGRLTFQKGPEYFIDAAKLILQKDENVHFVMAGTGDMMEKLIKYVARSGISTKFHFTGFLRGEEVDKMFAMSDVFVMPSVSEPFGLVPLEAMRLNVPVVISKQSGVSEVLEHALKVDFWDVNAMSDSIYALLHYHTLSSMYKKYGKVEIDNMKWDKVADKISTIYNNLLNN